MTQVYDVAVLELPDAHVTKGDLAASVPIYRRGLAFKVNVIAIADCFQRGFDAIRRRRVGLARRARYRVKRVADRRTIGRASMFGRDHERHRGIVRLTHERRVRHIAILCLIIPFPMPYSLGDMPAVRSNSLSTVQEVGILGQ